MTKVLIVTFTLLIVTAACQPLALPRVDSTIVPLPAASPSATSASTVPSASPLTVVPSPTVPPSPEIAEEEDCMAGCHIPDSNEFFSNGAMPQPATHVKRTMCLDCHATLAQPVLPQSHKGRMNPSCALCHVESAD